MGTLGVLSTFWVCCATHGIIHFVIGDLLEENDKEDGRLGQGERELAAVAGGHISTEARVVISSWLAQIVVLPS